MKNEDKTFLEDALGDTAVGVLERVGKDRLIVAFFASASAVAILLNAFDIISNEAALFAASATNTVILGRILWTNYRLRKIRKELD